MTRISDQPKLTQKRSQFHRAIGTVDGHTLMLSYGDDRMSNGFVLERYTEGLVFENDRKFEVANKQIVLKVFMADSMLYSKYMQCRTVKHLQVCLLRLILLLRIKSSLKQSLV